jgi:hypothetical protein
MEDLITKLLREGLIKESFNGKHLVVVDVQPIYESACAVLMDDLIEFINENHNNFSRITFLYNGPEFGEVEINEYQWWWIEKGLLEDLAYNINWYDKGYAFFRSCMDNGGDSEEISDLVRFMMERDVHDSRELDKEFWSSFVQEYGHEDLRDLMEFSDDAIHIPELMDELRDYNNILMCGGARYECLHEVEIALDALNKPYEIFERFVYD